MANQSSRRTPVPTQPKRSAFPSSLPSVRRPPTSSITNNTIISVGPTSTAPLSSNSPSSPTGIPAFRSLRSLLPFGPNKQATPISNIVSPSPHASRSPFANFGAVRRSMNRESKASLSADLPVISIGHLPSDSEEVIIRKSVSCSRLEKPLPVDSQTASREEESNFLPDNHGAIHFSAPVLQTPSPGPVDSGDLSTILEADTSRLSKHGPLLGCSRSSSPSVTCRIDASAHSHPILPQLDKSLSDPQNVETVPDADNSVLDLSTTQLTSRVLDAMMQEDSKVAKQWLSADTAVIVDDNEPLAVAIKVPDLSLNLGALDPDLAALLSPHRLSHSSNLNITTQPAQPIDILQPSQPSPADVPSPSARNFLPSPPSPVFHPGSSSLGYVKVMPRSRLPRQQSSLPRLRRLDLPTTGNITANSGSPDGDVGTTSDASEPFTPALPSPLSTSTSVPPPPSSVLAARRTASQPKILTPSFSTSSRLVGTGTIDHGPAVRNLAPPLLSQPETTMEGSPTSKLSARVSSLPATVSQLPGSTGAAQRFSPDSMTRVNLTLQSFGLSPNTPTAIGATGTISTTPTIISTPARPSEAVIVQEEARVGGRSHYDHDSSSAAAALARARGRSMSVQERVGQQQQPHRDAVAPTLSSLGLHREDLEERRASSSLSWRSGVDIGVRGPPVAEWLGPRTAKAFKAAGLMDFGREREKGEVPMASPGEGIGFGSANGSGSGISPMGRFGSMRSTSEYNPRPHSRIAVSEARSTLGGGSASRRGSGTFSYWPMESPTFTTSSGSRDTPRSVSTAPTSVSGSSFGFLGREREREREEVHELKEKHATETGALLGALSDSQRTTRLLRDENGDLRKKLEHMEAENDELKRVVENLGKEVGDLRTRLSRANNLMWSGTGSERRSRLNTPVPSCQEGWPTLTNEDRDRCHDHDMATMDASYFEATDRLLSINDQDNGRAPSYRSRHRNRGLGCLNGPGPASSSTPSSFSKTRGRRRLSTTSSVFPVPPPNMTMLLHDGDRTSNDRGEHNDSCSQLSCTHTHSPPVSVRGKGRTHTQNNSIVSTTSISPTIASFSMITGSPGSLFLRPEHEVLLGDLESLDLGVRREAEGREHEDEDGWRSE